MQNNNTTDNQNFKNNFSQSFLANCIQDIIKKHGTDFSDVYIIFPNKRPIVYLKKYLSEIIEQPCFLPKFFTIQDFFLTNQTSVIPEKLVLINELHKLYCKKTGSNEHLEDFYSWGEILLNDFEDIDNYVISAEDIFQNLQSIKEFSDEFSYLSDEQKNIISRFWNVTNNTDKSEIQKKFIDIWSVLADLYKEYTQNLQAKNFAYQGMAIRNVINELEKGSKDIFKDSKYIFIGFNALNTCEQRLFSHLHEKKQAFFYWDYDMFYKKQSHEAGYFICKNLSLFPNELDESYFNNFLKQKNITILETPNPVSQVKQCESWITDIQANSSIENSAIILANEQLLVPLMQSIPQDISYNISLGYPIKQTISYAFIDSILNLHHNKKNHCFYFKDILQVCAHPFIQQQFVNECNALTAVVSSNNIVYISQKTCKKISNIPIIFESPELPLDYLTYIKNVITFISKNVLFEEIEKSILYAIFKEIELLESMILKNEIQLVSISFTNNLIKKSIQSKTIPILGEPLHGLQIMGILETRLLDFTNLTILSVNENILPQKSVGASFIPYSLRTGFGMPTIKEQTAMYAYYFYRLLQRAEQITLVYSSQTDDSNSSEKSRYILQLLFESPFTINISESKSDSNQSNIIQKQINYPLKPERKQSIICNKKEDSIEFFNKLKSGEKKLSPTSLYTFVTCELKYYFKHILSIQPPIEIKELPDNRDFGNFFHSAMEAIYTPYKNMEITSSIITKILQDSKSLEKTILSVIDNTLYNSSISAEQKTQPTDLHYKITEKYIQNLLKFDVTHTPFTILDLEKELDFVLPIANSNIHIGGTIDRYDIYNNQHRIIDYKTGTNKHEFSNIEKLFSGNDKELNSAVFQTFMYSFVETQLHPNTCIQPNLLYLRDLHVTNNPLIFMKDSKEYINEYSDIQQEFEPLFIETIERLLNTNIPFSQTRYNENCKNCDYKTFCKK